MPSYRLLFVVILLISQSQSTTPWTFSGFEESAFSKLCADIPALNDYQKQLCQKQRDAVQVLGEAALLAQKECITQFRFDRWNCTLDALQTKTVNKEASFVIAIGSAAIVHQIARACADGAIRSCGCGANQEYSQACSDNINYGVTFAQQLLDIRHQSMLVHQKRREDVIRSAVSIHNNAAGRQLVEQTTKQKCVCHGLSGSCTTYTCYKQVSSFEEIGRLLYKRYKEAVRVQAVFTPERTTKLAFIDPSPDYCSRNSTAGIPGTGGRPCIAGGDSQGESCEHLCCGRGATSVEVVKRIPCKCLFKWCCEVECEECTQVHYQNHCND